VPARFRRDYTRGQRSAHGRTLISNPEVASRSNIRTYRATAGVLTLPMAGDRLVAIYVYQFGQSVVPWSAKPKPGGYDATMMKAEAALTMSLERRLQVLEDQQEIYHVLNQYSRTLDYGTDPKEWLEIFIDTGVWRVNEGRRAGQAPVRLEGHAQLEKFYMSFGRDKPEWASRAVSLHCWAVPEVDIDGDRATLDTYYFTPSGGDREPHIGTLGRYFVSLVRCPDARWRIEEMNIRRE
jgi:hypothetical protein